MFPPCYIPGGRPGFDPWVCPQCGRPGFDPWVGKILWRRKWQLTPVFLPGESHGRRSLVGYSPRGHKRSDMTERLQFQFQFQTMVGGNEDNGDLLQKVPCTHCYTQCPHPCSRPLPTHACTRDSWTLTGKSRSVSRTVTAPLFWVLVPIRFCLCPPRVCFSSPMQVLASLCGVNGNLLQEGLCHTQVCFTQSPCPCGRPLLIHTSSGDMQTRFWLTLCGVSGSWYAQD